VPTTWAATLSEVDVADLDRAIALAKAIDSMTKELESIKEKIREENRSTGVLTCDSGRILVTHQDPKWVLRKGVDLDRLAQELGDRFLETIRVTTNAEIRDTSTVLELLEPRQVSILMAYIERKEYKARIGFRWDQGEDE